MGHLIAFIVCLFCAVYSVFICAMRGIRGEAVHFSAILIMDAFVTAAITLGITL